MAEQLANDTRTFTITDESYDRMTARADAAGTNRRRLLEKMIDADLCISLDATVLTDLQVAADGEDLDLPTWSRRTLTEAAAPAPDGQVCVLFDASDLTLLQERAGDDNLAVDARVRKAALDAAAPPVVWPAIDVAQVREPFWRRVLPSFFRPARPDAAAGQRRALM